MAIPAAAGCPARGLLPAAAELYSSVGLSRRRSARKTANCRPAARNNQLPMRRAAFATVAQLAEQRFCNSRPPLFLAPKTTFSTETVSVSVSESGPFCITIAVSGPCPYGRIDACPPCVRPASGDHAVGVLSSGHDPARHLQTWQSRLPRCSRVDSSFRVGGRAWCLAGGHVRCFRSSGII